MKQVKEAENSIAGARIIIWGAGDSAREAIRYKNDAVEILGFLDNNSDIKEFEGLLALEKDIVYEGNYDYIVICARLWEEIYSQLLSMGVDREKILVNPIRKASMYRINQLDCFAKKWKNLS